MMSDEPLPDDFLTNPASRQAYIDKVFARLDAEAAERNARGLCADCDEPNVERYCQRHMDEVEAEVLADLQQMERLEESGVDLDDEDAVFGWLQEDDVNDDRSKT